MDDEHIGLFKAMFVLEADLGNQDVLEDLQEKMRDHFYAEEEKFCDSLDLPFDYCKEHKKKHVIFSGKFEKMQAPVDIAELKWAEGNTNDDKLLENDIAIFRLVGATYQEY